MQYGGPGTTHNCLPGFACAWGPGLRGRDLLLGRSGTVGAGLARNDLARDWVWVLPGKLPCHIIAGSYGQGGNRG